MAEDCTSPGPASTGFAGWRVPGALWLRLWGWALEAPPGDPPARFVFIAAPHTSAWDLPFMLATASVLGIRIAWLGKHTLFRPVVGRMLRGLGGIPVDRRAPHEVVKRAVEMFRTHDRLVLGIPAEGTRRRVTYWKSGFYHIAVESGVPIGLGFLDYGRRRCGLGPFLHPTGDVRRDMDAVRAFYRGIRGRNPRSRASLACARKTDPAPLTSQPRAPAAARSISSLAPAWSQGKKLVITTRTPMRV